jgi:hypothetical protein
MMKKLSTAEERIVIHDSLHVPTHLGMAGWFARWFIFKPKIQIWVNFKWPWNGKGRYIRWPF